MYFLIVIIVASLEICLGKMWGYSFARYAFVATIPSCKKTFSIERGSFAR